MNEALVLLDTETVWRMGHVSRRPRLAENCDNDQGDLTSIVCLTPATILEGCLQLFRAVMENKFSFRLGGNFPPTGHDM